jgi:hypothetical protein
MTRLQAQWQRLYLPHPEAEGAPQAQLGDDPSEAHAAHEPSLIDTQGRVRALVLTLSGPADWSVLSRVWHGVQADLAWPAPGIAVSGSDACQLWFSLQAPVSVEQAHALLAALRMRYLAHIKPARVGLLPRPDTQAPHQASHADRVPARPGEAKQWSAFVAPDLAPMFDETPWLDMPPSPEGQADLLAGLRSITPAAWMDALQWLEPPDLSSAAVAPLSTEPAAAFAPLAHLAPSRPQPSVGQPASEAHVVPPATSLALGATTTPAPPVNLDPRRFLQSVMNDPDVPLALRIEAAKALMPYSHS